MNADLTADEARTLTDRITGQVTDLLPLIREAFERRAWIALGHASWDAYCDAELRGLRLPVADRREAARELVDSGMSRRSAAAALGVGATTVRRDIADAQLRHNAAVEVDRSLAPTAPNGAVDEPETGHAALPPPAAPMTVLGADGRRRQLPTPSEAPRRPAPLLDEDPEARARAASQDLAKALVTLWAQWEHDPVRWVAESWRPDAYALRDLPRVRDVFTPSGLRSIAKSLDVLADDLDQKGATL